MIIKLNSEVLYKYRIVTTYVVYFSNNGRQIIYHREFSAAKVKIIVLVYSDCSNPFDF